VDAARTELTGVPGVPESRLPAALLADLPDGSPGPPWACRVSAIVWWHRAPPAALVLLPAPLAGTARRPYVVGALVRYLDSPVGPYEEVIGAVLPRPLPLVHVPFIAVDSAASLHGGRAHWALPKAWARFEHIAQTGTVQANGDGWRVAARPSPIGPWLPVAGRLRGQQLDAFGAPVTSTSTVLARCRAARVVVQVGSDHAGEPGSIADWLRAGRHRGILLAGRLRVAS